jgi:uroporphyrinogen decarboxylase
MNKQVREESRRLLELGREGSYLFAPSHAVESDVPMANILAFLEEAKAQRTASILEQP